LKLLAEHERLQRGTSQDLGVPMERGRAGSRRRIGNIGARTGTGSRYVRSRKPTIAGKAGSAFGCCV
jgi:hypothetical protein